MQDRQRQLMELERQQHEEEKQQMMDEENNKYISELISKSSKSLQELGQTPQIQQSPQFDWRSFT